MIPAFDENGQLPPGVHVATLDEVVDRFGVGSEDRIGCGQSLYWLIPICRQAGIVRVFINGSFVTEIVEARDADCVLIAGPNYNPSTDAAKAITEGLPYLSLQVAASLEEADFFLKDVFVTDRMGRAKGLIEVLL